MPNEYPIPDIQQLLNRLAERNELDPLAEQWLEVIKHKRNLLATPSSAIFVGEVGVGKSSLLAVTAGLLVGKEFPKDRSALKKQSLLAIGAGRTTICEVEIRAHDSLENVAEIGLLVEPLSDGDLINTLKLWAEDEWNRRRAPSDFNLSTDAPSNSQEITRALRNITGYAEKVEAIAEPSGGSRRRTIHPLDQVVASFDSLEAFSNHLLERAELSQRLRTSWWWPADSGRVDLKAVAEQINSGLCAEASLPQKMTIVSRHSLSENGWIVRLIDSRGLDSGVGLASRMDLHNYIINPQAINVLCTAFKSAPGESVRALLRELREDARWSAAVARTVLVLLDHGDADQVNGADGDRELGQEIKAEECRAELVAILGEHHTQIPIVVVDALGDHPARLINVIQGKVTETKTILRDELYQSAVNAQKYLDNVDEEQKRRLLPAVDQKIRDILSANLPEGVPLLSPIRGVLDAVRGTRFASVIYASCRRRGRYKSLDFHNAILANASKAATSWITPTIEVVLQQIRQLSLDPTYAYVADDLFLRRNQFERARLAFVENYAKQVYGEVSPILERDSQLWAACNSQWGLSNGFKGRIEDLIQEWAAHQFFSAHEKIRELTSEIPFWSEVAAPTVATSFLTTVKLLRAVKESRWKPNPVSLLIGANGAGKSTLLQSLRLLRSAYERGLPTAVRTVFGGSANLRSWGAPENDAIELGFEVDGAVWKIQLHPKDGTVDASAEESLTYQDQTVFHRDALEGIKYGREIIPTFNEFTALRVLTDRGAIDSPIRKIVSAIKRIGVFAEPDLWSLKNLGSEAADDRQLQPRGSNVLSVLRRWRVDRNEAHRFQFVLQGLQAAFPSFRDLDFESAGGTLAARVYRAGLDVPTPLANEANGVLQMLVLLANVASAEPGGIVAIDEPENGLHPFALQVFLKSCYHWANRHHVTILLATHSTILLDEMSGSAESVFVMKTAEGAQTLPSALDVLCNPDWFEGFKFGDLYGQGEIGSNNDQ